MIFMTVVVCWKMLSGANEEGAPPRNVEAVAMLSVMAVTIKLNALPMALVCAALFWMRRDVALRARIIGTVWLALIAAPLIVAS